MFRILQKRLRLNKFVAIVFLLQFFIFIILTTIKSMQSDFISQRNMETRDRKQYGGQCWTLSNGSECVGGPVTVFKNRTEIRTEILTRQTDFLQKHLKEFPDVVLNPSTEKSVNSNAVVDLTKMLHSSISKPYLIENPDLCSSVDNLTVMVIVHSAPHNFEKRDIIRQTWTNNSYYPKLGTVRTIFLLGRSGRDAINSKIKQEFQIHGDILQGDFVDSYHNITIKGVMGYKWLTERCRNAKIILKVDDDVTIDMFYFLSKHVSVMLSKQHHISCRLLLHTQIQRNPRNKWYVGPNQFTKDLSYPPYCQGFMVAFSNDVIPILFKSALVTPFFWIDDIFLYGLVPRNVKTMNYNRLQFGTVVTWSADDVINCFKKRIQCNYFVVLIFKDIPNNMKLLWSLFVQNYRRKLLS